MRKCNTSHAGSAGKRPGFAGYIHDCSSSVAYHVEGQKLRAEDLPPPRPNTWAEECTAIATMLLFFGCVSFLPPCCFGCAPCLPGAHQVQTLRDPAPEHVHEVMGLSMRLQVWVQTAGVLSSCPRWCWRACSEG